VLGLVAIGALSFNRIIFEATAAAAEQSLRSHYSDAYTYKTFLEHPVTALKVFAYTVLNDVGLIIDIPSGFTFSSRLHLWIYYLIFGLLLLNSSAPAGETPLKMPRSTRLILLACVAVVYLLVLFAAVSWTPVGSAQIVGVQGRYFIPLIPLLVLASCNIVRPGRDWSRASLYLLCCLSGLDVLMAFVATL
jgi:uncharacterized membrane protein